jgi:hypothetical protein
MSCLRIESIKNFYIIVYQNEPKDLQYIVQKPIAFNRSKHVQLIQSVHSINFRAGKKSLYDLLQTWNSVPYTIFSKTDRRFSDPPKAKHRQLASCEQLPLKCNIVSAHTRTYPIGWVLQSSTKARVHSNGHKTYLHWEESFSKRLAFFKWCYFEDERVISAQSQSTSLRGSKIRSF